MTSDPPRIRVSSFPEEAPSDYELVLELNYRFNVTGGFFIQPDIQGVIQPDGVSGIPDALVLSLNFGFAL